MSDNLRLLLEHFCLDGKTIDISSKLDEENAKNIEKINDETVPAINSRIDSINDVTVPTLERRISDVGDKADDNTSRINTINETSIPNLQNEINTINESLNFGWKNILNTTTESGIKVIIFINEKLRLVQLHASMTLPSSNEDGLRIRETLPGLFEYTPHYTTSAPLYFGNHITPESIRGTLTALHLENDLAIELTISDYVSLSGVAEGGVFYYY